MASIAGGREIDDTAVIHGGDAGDELASHATRVEVGLQDEDLETFHRLAQPRFERVARSCRVDGILDEQQLARGSDIQAAFQRTAGQR